MTVRQRETAQALHSRRFRFLVLYCNTPVKPPDMPPSFRNEKPPGQRFAVPAVELFHYRVAPQLQRYPVTTRSS